MGTMPNSPGPGQLEPSSPDSAEDNAPPADAEGETADVPLALLGGEDFKPGEEVVMKIVSIDKENGMAKIAYSYEDKGDGAPASDEHPAVAGMPGEGM